MKDLFFLERKVVVFVLIGNLIYAIFQNAWALLGSEKTHESNNRLCNKRKLYFLLHSAEKHFRSSQLAEFCIFWPEICRCFSQEIYFGQFDSWLYKPINLQQPVTNISYIILFIWLFSILIYFYTWIFSCRYHNTTNNTYIIQ